jgi:hypothetical protein
VLNKSGAAKKIMRRMMIGFLTMLAILVRPAGPRRASAESQTVPPKAAEPPIQSGVYGFSGGKIPGADFPEGVIGECIWIFDEANRNQVAKGECSERSPGKFRVVLKPGRYVVRGPGGNKPIDLKAGNWIKIESVTLLPGGP